ncbi:MAG: glycosyltransferase [Oceanospirillaceae bacterium]|nr:glycosyltransferase [Oceanospirillaceae bacterium]
MNKKILFIVSGYYLNGGTTFLVRLIRELSKSGVLVEVLFLEDKGDKFLRENLSQFCRLHFLMKSNMFSFLYRLIVFKRRSLKESKWLSSFDHVHVMGTFPLAYVLSSRESPRGLSVGVYQQNEYFNSNKPKYLFQKLILDKLLLLRSSNWLFFNECNRSYFSEFFNNPSLLDASVIPIGIANKSRRSEDDICKNLIVSVGNLMSFKTYYLEVIKVVEKLAKKGIDLKYVIYGSGPDESELSAEIKKRRLDEKVILKGRIDYTLFDEYVSKAKVFVGSGTSLLESAILGVPSIVGVENSTDGKTYGFLHKIKGYSYNENNLDLEKYFLEDLIFHVLDIDINSDCYQELCRKDRAKAKEFEISNTANLFKEFIDKSSGKDEILFQSMELIKATISVFIASLAYLLKLDKSVKERKSLGNL